MSTSHSISIFVMALILTVSADTCSNAAALDSSSLYPVVPSSNVDTLICYMKTASGTILDLGNLCRDFPKASNDVGQLLTTKQCQGCNLSGVNLSSTNLSGANLSGANLRGANLSGTDLSGANLRGASLGGTSLNGTKLRGTIMPDGSISD